MDPEVNPGVPEDCGPAGEGNGIDDDCNGRIDERCGTCFIGSVI